jgi:hypothetical protein
LVSLTRTDATDAELPETVNGMVSWLANEFEAEF